MLHSNDLQAENRVRAIAFLSEVFKQEGLPYRSTSYELNDTTRLRVVPLAGDASVYAIFVERATTRTAIDVMVQRYKLTRREAEVLALVVAGKTGPQIAEILSITTATASDHTSNLLRKVGVQRRIELAARLAECEHDASLWNADQG